MKPKFNATMVLLFAVAVDAASHPLQNGEKTVSSSSIAVRTVAYTGQQAPETTAGAVFDFFYPPTISPSGRVMFTARLWGAGVNQANDHGVWAERFSLDLVARKGDPAPGFPPGTVFEDLGYSLPLIAPHHNVTHGHTMFFASLNGFGTSLWLNALGPSSAVAHSNMRSSIGTILSPLRYNGNASFSYPLLFSSIIGDTLTLWKSPDSPDSTGHFGFATVVRGFQQIPGHVPGRLFSGAKTYVLTDSRSIVFQSAVRTLSSTDLGTGIWREASSQLSEVFVAVNGMPVNLPGLNSGESISTVDHVLANSTGTVAFTATVAGSPSGTGFWAQEGSSWQLVMRRGMSAPGTPQGVTFQGLSEFSNSARSIFFTNNEETIFMAKLEGTGVNTTNDMGVWRKNSTGLHMVAREGDQMSGAASGVVFDRIEQVASSKQGEIIILTSVRGPGITTANNLGIWALNSAGEFVPAIRKGDRVEVEPGVLRTINTLTIAGGDPDYYSTGADGRSTIFSDLKQIVFYARFLDSAIFVDGVCVAALDSLFTDIQGTSDRLPDRFSLHQNYPNPFNPKTTIRFQTASPGHVELSVHDVLGRTVAALVHEEMQPGNHEVTWDAKGHASGVYLYRLRAGNFVSTRKLVLIR